MAVFYTMMGGKAKADTSLKRYYQHKQLQRQPIQLLKKIVPGWLQLDDNEDTSKTATPLQQMMKQI